MLFWSISLLNLNSKARWGFHSVQLNFKTLIIWDIVLAKDALSIFSAIHLYVIKLHVITGQLFLPPACTAREHNHYFTKPAASAFEIGAFLSAGFPTLSATTSPGIIITWWRRLNARWRCLALSVRLINLRKNKHNSDKSILATSQKRLGSYAYEKVDVIDRCKLQWERPRDWISTPC